MASVFFYILSLNNNTNSSPRHRLILNLVYKSEQYMQKTDAFSIIQTFIFYNEYGGLMLRRIVVRFKQADEQFFQ